MKSEPNPTSLKIGNIVQYRMRKWDVIAQSGKWYLIKDQKQQWHNRWVQPKHVQVLFEEETCSD